MGRDQPPPGALVACSVLACGDLTPGPAPLTAAPPAKVAAAAADARSAFLHMVGLCSGLSTTLRQQQSGRVNGVMKGQIIRLLVHVRDNPLLWEGLRRSAWPADPAACPVHVSVGRPSGMAFDGGGRRPGDYWDLDDQWRVVPSYGARCEACGCCPKPTCRAAGHRHWKIRRYKLVPRAAADGSGAAARMPPSPTAAAVEAGIFVWLIVPQLAPPSPPRSALVAKRPAPPPSREEAEEADAAAVSKVPQVAAAARPCGTSAIFLLAEAASRAEVS
ncbi:hypothetical protein GPECTOR_7g1024 [Gonium pectorale]|uniref:Uncharacterized protein n=1 Tax=Gonium pectorale TaxID=33097 RepID=A0A150GTM6_GONPE|nr:hypothetical protein GPECTOR_7g1024 [Gonium pectorale]|eukprot:KXZ53133.1 hypothetical protein GPECTOR_7g1024 [Gonium pectorale]